MAVDLTQDLPPSLEERFRIVLELTTVSNLLSDAMKTELKEMFAPANLAVIIGVLMIWASSHAFGAGLIFDVGLLGYSLFMVGWTAWEAAEKIAEFIEKTVRARNMNDLEIASAMLATAIAILSVKMFQRLITKGASGATSGGKSKKGDAGKGWEKAQDEPRRARGDNQGTGKAQNTSLVSGGGSSGVVNSAKSGSPQKTPVTSGGTANSAQGAKLKRHLEQQEKYGAGGTKELQNGRMRYYGEVKPARNPGEMVGARLVREWDPATDKTRTWYETLDGQGRVRSVAPKPVTGEKNHRIFDKNGNYSGRR